MDGEAASPVESSTEAPAIPVLPASRSVSATPSGATAKQRSRSALTGSGVAAAISRAWASASSRVTKPSRRPSVPA
jgi:hypothetical protein